MNGPMTWEAFNFIAGVLVAAIVGALGVWWRIEKRIEKAEKNAADALAGLAASTAKSDEAHTDALITVAKDLADYKLAAADRFAANQHLKEAELRLTKSIDRLSERLEELTPAFAKEVARIVGELLADGSHRRRP